jgi:hypothetical protein
LQVLVLVVLVVIGFVVDGAEVVVSSRQPHHPGVLQVSVLVRDVVVAVAVVDRVDVCCVPFSHFQR